MLKQIEEAIFRKRKEIFAKGHSTANVKVKFSRDGRMKALAEARAQQYFNVIIPADNEAETFMGYPTEIDTEMEADFSVEEM